MVGSCYRKKGLVQHIPGCVDRGRSSRGRLRKTSERTMRLEAGDECWGTLTSWLSIECSGVSSLRPYASLWVPQGLID